MKKQKWEGVKKSFDNIELTSSLLKAGTFHEEEWMNEKGSIFTKLKGMFQKNKQDEAAIPYIDSNELSAEEEELDFECQPYFYAEPKSLEDLKVQFLNQLFPFQLKWASSTLTEKSIVKKAFYYDEALKYYLQRFPDTYLVLYKPVFILQNAPIELDTIIITPTGVWCITLLEAEDSAVFVGSNEKFWTKKKDDKEKKILSPLITINKTEKVVKKILEKYEIDFPVKKAILTRNGYIDYPMAPHHLTIIEKRNYDDWLKIMRHNHSPLKAIQLKTAEKLLYHCLTTCMRRYEWDIKEE
ncbi:nuclease-related domain-containing protein [Niallia sp. 03133]|uniref:nuclease-related domain-containing protein n=1 Tax=Niallia sp. 03133 TaxID=3458060 RepID=UPI004044C5CE